MDLTVATWNELLSSLQQASNRDHQENDAEAMSGIPKAEGPSEHRVGCKPFEISRGLGDRP